MNTVDVLIAARAVISDPGNWCKDVRRNSAGQHCALGAFEVAISDDKHNVDEHPAVVALGEVAGMLDPELSLRHYGDYALQAWTVSLFNNKHTHAELMHAFDLAIASEKARRTLLDIKTDLVTKARKPELADG